MHFAEPDEAQLNAQMKNVDNARLKTTKVVLPSGMACSMMTPDATEVRQETFNAPPKTIQQLQV